MPKEFQFQTSPEIAANEDLLRSAVAKQLGIPVLDIQKASVQKRSIDARQKMVKINVKGLVYLKDESIDEVGYTLPDYPDVSKAPEVIVIGSGPGWLVCCFATH
jgi:hypothetical protein